MEMQNDGIAKHALNRMVQKLSGLLGVDLNAVMNELTQYKEQQGPYGPLGAPNICKGNLLPHQWWHRVGGNALPIITKRILLLICSVSLYKQNLSMYSFLHSRSWNRLEVDKAKALFYDCTKSELLHQRPGADPIRYHDDNIFSEDSNDDGGVFSNKDDNNNDDNDGQGHDGNDRDASDGEKEHFREYLPINLENVHHENPFDWNKINNEVTNDFDEHVIMEPIENMHVDEGQHVGARRHGYD
jgi:hypothetical protein